MEPGQIAFEMIAPAAWVGSIPQLSELRADRWQRTARTIFVALLLVRASAPTAAPARAPGCYLHNAVTWSCVEASDQLP